MTSEHQASPEGDSAQRALLDFLREHDAACPACGYNLRAAVEARCPECATRIELTVGAPDLEVMWLIATVAPCIFSAIAALLMAIPMVVFGGAPAGIWVLDGFGWASALVGAAIIAKRRRFVRLARAHQIYAAGIMWFVHIAAFVFGVLPNL
jgi:uncharacterized paraquat-inducible protein A